MTPEEIAQRLAGSPVLGVDGRSVGSVLDADVGADGTVSVCIEVEPGAAPPRMLMSIGYACVDEADDNRDNWYECWEIVREGDDLVDRDNEMLQRAEACLLDRSAKDPLTLPPERGQPRTRIDGHAAGLRQMLSDTSQPLDAIVSIYGVQRMEGESDADLRGRIVATVMSPDAIRGQLRGLYETWVGEGLADPVALDLVSRNVDVDDHTHPD